LGDGLKFGAEYKVSDKDQVYSKYQYNTDPEGGSTFLTMMGDKGKINDQLDVYSEHQVTFGSYEASTGNLLGFSYKIQEHWVLSADYTISKVDNFAQQPVYYYPTTISPSPTPVDLGLENRNIFGIGLVYHDPTIDYKSRLQIRTDEGVEQGGENLRQIATINSYKRKINDDLSYIIKLDYSITKDLISLDTEARDVEATFGLAYRPVKNDRFNLIGEYSYLDELSPVDQIDGTVPPERTHLFTLDGIYELSPHWQFSDRIAFKRGEIGIDSNSWEDNDVYLWVNRLSYHTVYKWDITTEYRTLWDFLAGDKKSGFLVGAYHYLNKNVKFGIGYNFTNYNDNLANLSYRAGGLFINVVNIW
jgi:hypothetical protein